MNKQFRNSLNGNNIGKHLSDERKNTDLRSSTQDQPLNIFRMEGILVSCMVRSSRISIEYYIQRACYTQKQHTSPKQHHRRNIKVRNVSPPQPQISLTICVEHGCLNSR